MVLLGERRLRRAIAEHMEPYHLEPTHHGLDDRRIDGLVEHGSGTVARCERIGGMLSFYYREAA